MVDKTREMVATYVATQYSRFIGRTDQFSLGRKVELISIAEYLGFEVTVIERTVILRSVDQSIQICA